MEPPYLVKKNVDSTGNVKILQHFGHAISGVNATGNVDLHIDKMPKKSFCLGVVSRRF